MSDPANIERGELPSVLYVASGSLWAGAEMQVYTLIDSSGQRCQVQAVLFSEGILADKLRDSGLPVHVLDETKLGFIQMVRQFHSLLSRLQVDIIHTHGYKENIIGGLVGYVNRIPSIRTVHGDNEFTVKLWNFKKSIPSQLNLFTGRFLQKKIISVSTELAEKLGKKYPRKKIHVIPNGINVDKVVESSNHPVDLPGKSNSFKVVFIGRLVKLKRVDIVLESYSLLLKEHGFEYELYLVGEGDQKDSLMELSQELGVEKGVHFLGHRTDVHSIMRAVDCLIMTSDHEGLPMTILESMAVRLPIVSHAVGEIPEVLQQGECGYLVHDQQPQSYKSAIETCHHDPDKQALIDAAYNRVKEHYSHKINANQVIDLYLDVLNIKSD